MWRQDTSVVYRRCTVIRGARGTNVGRCLRRLGCQPSAPSSLHIMHTSVQLCWTQLLRIGTFGFSGAALLLILRLPCEGGAVEVSLLAGAVQHVVNQVC